MDSGEFTNIFNRMKPKNQNIIRTDAYTETGLNFIANIINIKNFDEQTGLDQRTFQMIKASAGMVGLAKHGDNFVLCEVTQKGLPRRDWKPEQVIARYWDNQQLYVETMTNDVDIVLLYNTPLMESEKEPFRVASALADTDNSLRLLIKYTRYLPLLMARNNKEKEVLLESMKAMDRGENVIVTGDELSIDEILGEKRDILLNVTDPTLSDKMQYIMETHDNLLRKFFNKYGLYTSGNAKHAQQSKMEIDNGESASWVYPLIYLKETDDFCKRANNLFGLSLDATFSDLHSLLWQKFILQHEPTESENVDIDNVTDIVKNEEREESENESETETTDTAAE